MANHRLKRTPTSRQPPLANLSHHVAPTIIKELVEQDRREFFAKWLAWVNEPIRPYLVVRLMPAIYSETKVPPEIATMAEAEKWAASFAAEMKMQCCLVWSRRISC